VIFLFINVKSAHLPLYITPNSLKAVTAALDQHGSSSEVARGKAAATLPLKINSFEAALAKKGVTLEKALEKSGTGSPRKELYLADLNGHRLL
jgi:hypothetical protein